MAKLPLRGLRVVNFGWYWAGPVAGQVLGDMGAELITIESRKRITGARHAPPFLHNEQSIEFNLWAHNIYRSAYSVTLDLAHPKAQDVFKRLMAVTDVLIYNFSGGVMDKVGLGYEELRKVNPTLLVVSLAAAGVTGPLKEVQFFGSVLAGVAGLDALQGYQGERPATTGAAVPDPLNGVMGAFATLAALRKRKRTGRGGLVDVSQMEALGLMTGAPVLDYWFNKRVQGPMGNKDPRMAPHGVYRSKGEDAWVAIAVGKEEEWRRFREALGAPRWTEAERFSTLESRLRHQEELDRHVAEWTREHTHYEATRVLQEHGVAAFPALSQKELFDDPHWKERGTWVEVDHALGRETISGIHWHFSETPGEPKANHILGEDNRIVLSEILGIPEETVEVLEKEGVLT